MFNGGSIPAYYSAQNVLRQPTKVDNILALRVLFVRHHNSISTNQWSWASQNSRTDESCKRDDIKHNRIQDFPLSRPWSYLVHLTDYVVFWQQWRSRSLSTSNSTKAGRSVQRIFCRSPEPVGLSLPIHQWPIMFSKVPAPEQLSIPI